MVLLYPTLAFVFVFVFVLVFAPAIKIEDGIVVANLLQGGLVESSRVAKCQILDMLKLISIPINESKFSSFGQVFTQIYPRDQWHFATLKSRENADLKNYRKLSPLQLSLSHPENIFNLSKQGWVVETLCHYLSLCTPCICQPRVNIATKKAGELFEKE